MKLPLTQLSAYNEGSEKYYVAIGILRNKRTGTTSFTLSPFNTVLNFQSIMARLEHLQINAHFRLWQGGLSFTTYYDTIDKHLTLIIYKQIMNHGENNEMMESFNASRTLIMGTMMSSNMALVVLTTISIF